VSEQPVSEAKPPPKKAAGKKVLGLPLPVVIGGAAALAAAAYLWLRSRKKSSSGTAASSSTSTTTSSAYASNLDQMQAELDQLLAEQSGAGSGGYYGAGGTGTTTGTTAKTTSKTTAKTTAGTTSKTTAKTTAKTTSKTGTGTAKLPAAPGGLTSTAQYESAIVRWKAVTGATRYRARVWHDTGKTPDILHDSTAAGTTQTITGLKAKTRYGWHVAAVGSGGEGPWSVSAYFTTK